MNLTNTQLLLSNLSVLKLMKVLYQHHRKAYSFSMQRNDHGMNTRMLWLGQTFGNEWCRKLNPSLCLYTPHSSTPFPWILVALVCDPWYVLWCIVFHMHMNCWTPFKTCFSFSKLYLICLAHQFPHCHTYTKITIDWIPCPIKFYPF